MPVTLHNFPDDSVNMRFRMLYVTKGLNHKRAVNTPPGIYRGFKIGTHATDNFITIEAHPTEYDHYAIYQTTAGASVSIHNRNGSYPVDLSPLVEGFEKELLIVLYAEYAIGGVTNAEIRAYEISPEDTFTGTDEDGEAILLGTVIVPPGGGTITEISHSRRTSSWRNRAPEKLVWAGVVRNGSFEQSDTGSSEYATKDWVKSYSTGTFQFSVDTVDAVGGSQSLLLNWSSGTAAGEMRQHINAPCYPGQLIKAQWKKKQVALTTAGDCFVAWGFADKDGAFLSEGTSTLANEVDGSWVTVDEMIEVPADAYSLSYVRVVANDITLGASGDVMRLDDIQFWVAPKNYELAPYSSRVGTTHTIAANVRQATSPELARMDYSDPTVSVQGAEGGSGNMRVPNDAFADTLTAGSDIISTSVEAETPRLVLVPRGSGITGILESQNGAMEGMRVYTDATGRTSIVSNAYWDGTQWNQDDAAEYSYEVRIETGQLQTYIVEPATPAWADNAWTPHYSLGGGKDKTSACLDLSVPLISTDADNDLPRLITSRAGGAESTRALIWQIDGTNTNIRLYALLQYEAASLETFEFTVNAAWDNTSGLWTKDDDTTEWASRLTLNSRDFRLEGRTTTAGTWDDTGWTNQLHFITDTSGDLVAARDVIAGDDVIVTDDISAGSTIIAGTNDDSTGYFFSTHNFNSRYWGGGTGLSGTNHNGRIYKNNEIRAWGLIWVYNTSVYMIDGFGLNSLSFLGTNNQKLRVGMGDSYNVVSINGQNTYGYTVLVNCSSVTTAGDPDAATASGHNYFTYVSFKSSGYFDIERMSTAGGQFYWQGNYRLVRVVVLGVPNA